MRRSPERELNFQKRREEKESRLITNEEMEQIRKTPLPKEIIDKEKEIFEANSAETGKPQDIINKMVEGKLKKYFAEVSLNDQDFVKESGLKIRTLLKKNKAKVLAFERFEVGEGVEIEETDFVTEVMSQIKNI